MKKKLKKDISVPVTVPEIEINTPLPEEVMPAEPIVDEVMIRAKRKWMAGMGIFILFIVILGCVAFGYNKISSAPMVQIITPTPQIIVPSPTPVVVMRIAVWNGSGVGGLAGKVRDGLKIEGYNVVEVTNAPTVQKGTTLLLNSSVKSKETELVAVLKKNLIEVMKVEDLTEGEYDVKIILGN
ncbi:MAG: LytR C-terminal domain-containing protein [Candidatus Roizmanbacteria bacterium]|nr:LytR C-terminal domain-containing protein [Candidatus Roizmanbacteria bacterium]